MYTSRNFKTKKAFKEAVKAGEQVTLYALTLYAPGMGRMRTGNQRTVEGPHYPQPHTWYARVKTDSNGVVIKVK